MTSSEAANLPRFRGQKPFYEIWFLVVFERDRRRATWLRYTLDHAASDARATLWAASFHEKEAPIVEKRILPIDRFNAGPRDRFCIRIDDAELAHGSCRGTTGRVAWDLRFVPADREVVRTPRLAAVLPMSTRAIHVHDGVPFDGWIEVDGARRVLDGAAGTQTHIWGAKRIRHLTWVYALGSDDAEARLEIVGLSRAASLFLRERGHALDLTQLPAALASRAVARGPGIVDVYARSARRVIHVRAECDPRTLAGYAYRDPASGEDLLVAQSDVARCHVEVFRRTHPLAPLVPERESTWRGAVELHGPDPLAGVHYAGWDATSPGEPFLPALTTAPPAPTQEQGEFEDLPAPRAIVALGLTYRAHAGETGSDGQIAAFTKDVASFLPLGHRVATPSSEELLAAIGRVDPGLAAALRTRFGFLPAMLDYEAELGMMLLEHDRVGWFVANDLTARSVQVLGSGAQDPMPFWSTAKSFTGFLPVTPRMWVSDARVPQVTLITRVNGVIRQQASTTELALRPAVMRARARALLGRELAPGDVILTGTPAGVAFHVSRWRRHLAERFLDRLGRLRAAIGLYATSDRFLHPGDVVEVEAGFLGRRSITVDGR